MNFFFHAKLTYLNNPPFFFAAYRGFEIVVRAAVSGSDCLGIVVPIAIFDEDTGQEEIREEEATCMCFALRGPPTLRYNGQLMAGGPDRSSLNANRSREAPRWTKPVV